MAWTRITPRWPAALLFCLGLLSPLAAQEPRLRATLKGHSDEVTSVAFGPDGKTLASGSSDRTIKLWDVQTGKRSDE